MLKFISGKDGAAFMALSASLLLMPTIFITAEFGTAFTALPLSKYITRGRHFSSLSVFAENFGANLPFSVLMRGNSASGENENAGVFSLAK